MLSAAEILVQKANTAAFISADETSIVLNRADLVPNGAGGFRRGSADPLEPLPVRLVPQGVAGRLEERQLLDGQMVPVHFHLIADVDADVQRGDWFFIADEKHEVVWVTKPGGYETKAEVTNRG